MAKRQAESQITKDRGDDSDEDYENGQSFQKASANIMAKRRIAKPGKSRHAPSAPSTSVSSLGSNSGVGSVAGPSSVDINSKITALNKRFLESVLQYQTSVDSNQLINLVPVCQKYIDYYNSIKPSTNGNITTNGGAPKSLFSSITIPESQTGSNSMGSINTTTAATAAVPTSVSSLPAAPKLNAFTGISTGTTAPSFTFASSESKPNPFSGISTGFAPQSAPKPANSPSLFSFGKPSSQPEASTPSTSASTPATATVSAPAPVSAPETKPDVVEVSSSDESSDDEIKIQGPQFVLNSKPTIKNSPFSFGPKPEKKKDDSDSDSESEVEIKGPTFTFNKTIKDSVFKLKPTDTKKTEEQAKPTFSFGQGATSTVNSETKQTSSFGQKNDDKPVTNEKPAFSFGQKENKPADKPAFSFGQKEVATGAADKPAFSFGSSSTTGGFGSTSDKPAFNFSASDKPKVSDASEAAPKTFNSTSNNDDKPTFSFGGSKSNDAKPAFSFTSNTTTATTTTNNNNNNNNNNNATPEEPKPAFSFGGAKPFAFNSSSTENTQPTFQFNSKPATEEAKPAFSFGTPSTSEFGSGSGFGAPKFNFGGSNGTQSSLFGGENKSGFGFSFGSGSSSATTGATDSKKDTEAVVEEAESTAKFEPVVKLTDEVAATTGEENETVKYTKRSKLMLFQKDNSEEPYKTIGLGDLKVLKHNESGKSRVLIRTDGGQRILLNTFVDKKMKYDTVGNGSMVKVPVINPQTKELETYVVRVKTPADGKEFLDSLQQE